MSDNKKELLTEMFLKWAGEPAVEYIALPRSGSYREYYRMKGPTKTALGVFNSDKKENIAFLGFSKHFSSCGLPVPAILAEDVERDIYLVEDLGNETLFSYLTEQRKSGEFTPQLVDIYKRIIEILPKFQIDAGKSLDYSVCYPRAAFDKQSMMWDLNYFKYYFLKLAKVPFDEQALEHDFHTFTDYLLTANSEYFLYRDFQSRNIMLKNGQPYFIDYQGGRRGALHYDLASLLYDAKADIPQNIRTELLRHYMYTVDTYTPIDFKEFEQMFFGFVLIRIMQAMGAYGFRGFYEKKEHFLKSIPYAVDNLAWLLKNISFPVRVPALLDALDKIVHSKELKQYGDGTHFKYNLNISVNSFSYRQGIPQDTSGNGGGFVFDCRAIHNPGRYAPYKLLTGKDEAVKKFLEEQSEVNAFLANVFAIAKQSVEVYTTRKFTNLIISFGCTGGQHRSVYCAERMAEYLKQFADVKVTLRHIEVEKMQGRQ